MAFENLKSTGIKYVLTKLKDYFVQIKDAVKSVNGEEPDETGDITLTTVPYAQNLESESSHRNAATFTQRTAGGDSSVSDGDAWLMVLKGNSEHTGYTAESLEMEVTAVSDPPITATIDRDAFVEAVSESGTTTLVYTSAWSANPATYGVTVTGEPASGDTITITYVKEVRGTITVANPQKFIATGWNLYDHSAGYAKVVKYDFGYRIEGTYTGIKYSATPTGTQTDVAVNDGNFNITADGYIHVTGGNSTDTAIFATWEDWTEGYPGSFEAYIESEVDLSTVMASYFPNGLLKAGNTVDELDLNLGQAISRVERLSYTAENLATAKASGREYEYDENYIYLARASAVASSVSVDGGYSVDDHGLEYFTGSDVYVYAEVLYGNNLKNKLERDVLTISSQNLTAAQKAQVNANIGAVALVGDQTVSGEKTFNASEIVIQSTGKTATHRFKNASGIAGGTMQFDFGNATNQTTNRLAFYSYSPKETADSDNTGYYEGYKLPVPTVGRSSSVSYDILTSKNHMVSLGTFTSSSGIELTFSGSGAFIFVVGSINSARTYFGYGYSHATNAPIVVDINKGSNITVTASAGKITFTSSSSSQAALYVLNMDNVAFTWKKL